MVQGKLVGYRLILSTCLVNAWVVTRRMAEKVFDCMAGGARWGPATRDRVCADASTAQVCGGCCLFPVPISPGRKRSAFARSMVGGDSRGGQHRGEDRRSRMESINGEDIVLLASTAAPRFNLWLAGEHIRVRYRVCGDTVLDVTPGGALRRETVRSSGPGNPLGN